MLDLIMRNDARRALPAPASTPTPLAFPARRAPARDPRGGPRASISLPACVTPCSHSGLPQGFGARVGICANGVGGAALACPGQGGRVHLAEWVRT